MRHCTNPECVLPQYHAGDCSKRRRPAPKRDTRQVDETDEHGDMGGVPWPTVQR